MCLKNSALDDLRASLEQPVSLLKQIFRNLSMTRTNFKIFESASDDEIGVFKTQLDIFDDNILDLKSKTKLEDFPLFSKFLQKHSSLRLYSLYFWPNSSMQSLHSSDMRACEKLPRASFPTLPVKNT